MVRSKSRADGQCRPSPACRVDFVGFICFCRPLLFACSLLLEKVDLLILGFPGLDEAIARAKRWGSFEMNSPESTESFQLAGRGHWAMNVQHEVHLRAEGESLVV